MNPSISFTPLSQQHFGDLQKLFAEVFGKRYSSDYIRRKYNTSYLGIDTIAHLAYDGKKPIAFVGAIPMPFLFNEEKLIGVQYCDYMTLPQYRRKGIHTKLLQHNKELATAKGADFIFAMHTTNSSNGDLQFPWNFLDPLNAYLIPLKTPALSMLINKGFKFLKISGGLSARADQQVTHWKTNYSGNSLQVDYSESFLKYKSFSPSRFVQFADVKYWIRESTVLEVGNVEVAPGANFEKSFQQLADYASKKGCSKLIIEPRKNTFVDQILSKSYQPVKGYHPAYIALKPGLEVQHLQLNYCDFDTF